MQERFEARCALLRTLGFKLLNMAIDRADRKSQTKLVLFVRDLGWRKDVVPDHVVRHMPQGEWEKLVQRLRKES